MIANVFDKYISWSGDNKLRAIIALCGILISLVSYLLGDGIVNRDGILYLQVADTFNKSGFSASLEFFRWPFYSIIIAVVNSVTSISYETAAYLLNAFFILILTDSFVRFYWEANSKIYYRWMPAALLLAYTGLNDYRYMIVRDWGYWAFSFLAIYYFFRFYKYNKIWDVFLWQIFIGIAFLFRIEAVAFIFILPLFLFFKKKTIYSFINSIILFIACFVVFIFTYGLSSFSDLGRLSDIFSYLDIYSRVNEFILSSYEITKKAIPYHSENHAIKFVLGGLFTVLSLKVLFKLGYMYLTILLYGWLKHKFKIPSQHNINLFLLSISFVIVFVFFCKTKVITGRYTIQTTLFLLIIVTYYTDLFFYKINEKKCLLCIYAFWGLLGINLVTGMSHSGSTKGYLKGMGLWVKGNISASSRIISNDYRLCHYSGRQLNKDLISRLNNIDVESLHKYSYLLLKIKKNDNQYEKLIIQNKLHKVYEMINKSGDSAILFQIKKT